MNVKIGVTLPMAQDDGADSMPSYADIRSVARTAEDAGLDSIWGYDHLLFRDDDGDSGIHGPRPSTAEAVARFADAVRIVRAAGPT
jgi:alkanesulfonate monooxygenase SsuD/methylene tetrahydromethanopterin reductase-like flavin-dependent oxidoreductase (luciferase family)